LLPIFLDFLLDVSSHYKNIFR